jgi:hypothetical protein
MVKLALIQLVRDHHGFEDRFGHSVDSLAFAR